MLEEWKCYKSPMKSLTIDRALNTRPAQRVHYCRRLQLDSLPCSLQKVLTEGREEIELQIKYGFLINVQNWSFYITGQRMRLSTL